MSWAIIVSENNIINKTCKTFCFVLHLHTNIEKAFVLKRICCCCYYILSILNFLSRVKQKAYKRCCCVNGYINLLIFLLVLLSFLTKDKNKVKPEVLAKAKTEVEVLRGKLGLSAGATIDEISAALIAKNNNKLIDDYSGFVKTVKDNQ